jgi:hypothetical protein
LTVFAARDGDTLTVEAKFASGRFVREGTIQIFDADDTLIYEGRVSGEEITRLPMMGDGRGLRVEVDAGDNHRDYWIILPKDLAE